MAFNKKSVALLISGGIVFLYLLTRLLNLTSLPIFTDEAIYIRWAQIAGNDANWRFISLTDGKQPMYVWLAIFTLKLFKDPLFAGRFVSVLAGFGSLIGIYFLTSEIFRNKKMGVLASFVYVLYPFALVYDRLAIYDSLVAMFIIWALYFEVLLVRRLRFDLALVLGMVIGLGMLTKTSNNFAFYLLPFSLLLFDFKQKKWKEKLAFWFVFALAASLIANVMYLILKLSPFFHIIGQKNTTFVYPLSEWLTHPFTYLLGNLRGLSGWLLGYMTAPFLILALVSFLVGKKFFREKLLLFVWFLMPFTALALFGKVIYPRFIFFMSIPLLILGIYTLFYVVSSFKKIWQKILVASVFLVMFAINDFYILTDFKKAVIPQGDRGQFITGWPSGVGVKETVTYLTERSKREKIYVGTEGTFGLMPYALEIYLKDNKNIVTKGFWPINDAPPEELLEAASKMPAFVVFYQPCPSCPKTGLAPVAWPVKEVIRFEKLEKGSFYTLYEIKPQ